MSAAREVALRAEDARARSLAQREFSKPLVLAAGAGTGKTSTLVARVVAWCLGPGWERAEARDAEVEGQRFDRIAADVLSRVVAITFTEAAAAEMADRVGKAFAAVEAGGALPHGLERDALPDDAELCSARARTLHGALERLVVRTIHAFCRRLLAEHPLAAGLHPRFQVDADGGAQEQAVREVVERALREAYRGPASAPLVQLAADGFGPTAVEEALLALVAAGARATEIEADWLAPERLVGVAAALREATLAMREADAGRFAAVGKLATATAEAIDRTAVALDEPLADAGAFASALERMRDVWESNLLVRLRVWGNGTFTKGEKAAIAGDEERVAARAAELHPLLQAALRVDVGRLAALRDGLAPLLREVEGLLRERGVVTYDALLRDTCDLLRRHPALCAQLRCNIDQLLVDEFQDTDPVQCEIVRVLALEGAAEERPCLFLVGDPKQSIYGWRSADLRAYADFVDEVLEKGGERHALSVNFRSVPAILQAVERAIAPVMVLRPGFQPEFEPLAACEELADATGFARAGRAPVECWVSWLPEEEGAAPTSGANAERVARAEADAIACDLRELYDTSELGWSDAAILLRSTGDIEHYLGALREHGVPYAVARERSFYRRREVIEAVALVRWVLDPHDHVALLSVLRSAAVGVPDAALIPLWTREFPQRVGELHGSDARNRERLVQLRAAIDEVVSGLPAGVPGLESVRGWEHALVAALEALGPLRESFECDPPDRFVERLRVSIGFELAEAGRHLGGFRIANLERFFRELARDLAADIGEGAAAMGDEQAVLRRLRRDVAEGRERFEEPVAAGEDAVQVMTMHAAKGLDFAHVYVPQLHKGSGGSFAPLELGRGAAGLELRAPHPLSTQTPGFGGWEAQREQVERAELVRTLYVAATRAKQRLVLIGRWPEAAPALRVADAAKTHVDLLAMGGFQPRALGAAAAERAAEWIDTEGVRWRFPALAGGATGTRLPREAASLPPAERAASDAARIAQLQADAASRSARPWRATASSSSQHDAFEVRAARRYGARDADAEWAPATASASTRDVAMEAGNLVHRVLEEFSFGGDPEQEFARQCARLPELAGAVANARARDAACIRAGEILSAFEAGPLLERFAALGASVVARELPVWLAAPDGTAAGEVDPVGAIAGAVDLVYRDAGGGWVVADYKTDDVEGDALAERARSYAAQGAVYTRALSEGLGLSEEPRFELWFLRAGLVVDASGVAVTPG